MTVSRSFLVFHDPDALGEEQPGILRNAPRFGSVLCFLMNSLKVWIWGSGRHGAHLLARDWGYVIYTRLVTGEVNLDPLVSPLQSYYFSVFAFNHTLMPLHQHHWCWERIVPGLAGCSER